MVNIQQFLTNNKDLLGTVGTLIGAIAAMGGITWWWLQYRRKRQVRSNTFPFDVIKPQSGDVLKRLMPLGDDDDPLADRNIPYQERVKGKKVRRELEDRLDGAGKHHWVLIRGKTGLGKTREAAHLAASLNQEWTILNFKGDNWLETPGSFPRKEVGSDRKLLFFLDDLNRHTATGKLEQAPKAADDPLHPLRVPFQKRLLETLEFYEQCCGRENVWVIATARDETIPVHQGEPSPWEKLEWEKYPALWGKFICYDLDEPEDQAIVETLQVTVERAAIVADPADYPGFARRNDHTFGNIIQNVRDLKRENEALTPDTFLPQLQDTWEKHYCNIVRKYPVAKSVYDAVELLQMLRVDLYPFTIEATAGMLVARGDRWRWLWQRWRLRFVVRELIREYGIDHPQDGQIEAKGTVVEWWRYLAPLTRLVLRLSERYPGKILDSLFKFAYVLTVVEENQHVPKLVDRAVAIAPDDATAWFNHGWVLSELGRKEEALDSYEKALAIQPDNATAWFNHGWVLSDLGRKEEALDSYEKALAIQPDDALVWTLRGNVLLELGRKKDALDSYEKALEIQQDKAIVWTLRGFVLSDLGRKKDALDSYEKALAIQPDDAKVWSNRGKVLADLGRYDEALESYDTALTLAPFEGAIFYNKACCYSLQGEVEQALSMLQRAQELNCENLRERVETDADFDAIRGDGQFQAWWESLG